MTTPDVVVSRCVLRIHRRGGWSWGPRPRDLVPAFAQAVADLIAARTGELAGLVAGPHAEELAAGHDVEITSPVVLVVPVPLGAARLAADPQRLAEAVLAGAVLLPHGEPPETAHEPRLPGSLEKRHARGAASADPVRAGATSPRVALARLLASLRADPGLADLLGLLPSRTLRHFAAVLTGVSPGPRSRAAGPAPGASPANRAGQAPAGAPDLVAPTAVSPESAPSPGPPSPRVAGRAAAPVPSFPAAPPAIVDGGPEAALRLLAEAAALAVAAPGEEALTVALADRFGDAPTPDPLPGGPRLDEPRIDEPRLGVVEVRSALPFLVAAALSGIGVLDRIGAALIGAGLAADAPLFATALAYQVLGPLERGWRRPPADHADAAAFAGRSAAPGLASFAQRAEPALPLVDALLANAVASGHEPGRPLALQPVEQGLLLAEADGAFPLAWSRDPADLLPPWRQAGRPPVVLTGTLPPGPIRVLTEAGVPVCAPFPPTRGERWHRVPARRLWATTIDAVPPPPLDVPRLAETLTRQMDDAASRAAFPAAVTGELPLQRTVTLAAGIGLATIAWQLWHDREPTDAVLAVERFGDLSAVVTFTPDRVHVRLPLGRRHADLDRSGLLAGVRDAFWLGGRTLSFSGG